MKVRALQHNVSVGVKFSEGRYVGDQFPKPDDG